MHPPPEGTCTVEARLSRGAELHHTVLERKESMIFSYADVSPGENDRATLPDENRSDSSKLAVVELRPEIFGVRIAKIFGCSARFPMCHAL